MEGDTIKVRENNLDGLEFPIGLIEFFEDGILDDLVVIFQEKHRVAKFGRDFSD